MNDRGFITPLVVVGVMISTSILLAVSYKSVSINNVRISESETNIEDLIDVRTAYERIDGVFIEENIAPGIVSFDDIDKSVKLYDAGRTETTRTIGAVVIDSQTNEEYSAMDKKITINIPKKEVKKDETNKELADE